MKIHKLNTLARRTSLVGASLALVAAVVVPSVSVFANALNPLTERSLLLSSSAPGYQNSDGSNYSETSPNPAAEGDIPEHYAPAGSGPNGQKTGQTFSFRVSTDSTVAGTDRPIRAFTLQYCTTAAGNCQAPGDNEGDARPATDDRETNAEGFAKPGTASEPKTADLDASAFNTATAGDDYEIWMAGTNVTADWSITTSNREDDAHSGALTGKHNYITLTNTTGIAPAGGDQIRIVFKASEDHYITNPGSRAFFVKMNTYDNINTTEASIIDGGVTVANVMTDSIHITTKVLETMAFSVGTENRDTYELEGAATHGTCDPIEQANGNRLQLGNQDAESSLEVDTTFDVYSYWRLSSNSSGGASVYYSGNTLANTVGDEIRPIGPTAQESTQGTEQFGLAFVDAGADDQADFSDDFLALVADADTRHKIPTLQLSSAPDVWLAPGLAYANGTGAINGDTGPFASFAFEKESNTVPRVIAQNNQMVISCATAKMRYIANIGADTPAGVYTTKINYLAAPQY